MLLLRGCSLGRVHQGAPSLNLSSLQSHGKLPKVMSSCPQEVPAQLETQPTGMHFQSFRFTSTFHSFLQQNQHMGLLFHLFLFPAAAPAVLQELPSSLKYLVASPLPCAQLCSVPTAGRGLPGWPTNQNKVKCDIGTGGQVHLPPQFTAQPHGSLEVADGEGCPTPPWVPGWSSGKSCCWVKLQLFGI